MDHWLTRELELNQRHETILAKREAFLRGTEAYYDKKEERSMLFLTDYKLAKQRNEQMLKDFEAFQLMYKQKYNPEPDQKLLTLRTNYWSMVKGVLPVWQEELKDYKNRHKSPRAHFS